MQETIMSIGNIDGKIRLYRVLLWCRDCRHIKTALTPALDTYQLGYGNAVAQICENVAYPCHLHVRHDSEKPEDEPYIYISRYSGNGKLCSDYLDYLDWEDLFYDT
nr:MAG TPA: hypothetical protein [Caudoviricetes sp.]